MGEKREDAIQAECYRFLCDRNVFAHSVPNESAGRTAAMQSRLVSMGLRSGVADMVVWWPDGIGYVEFKNRTGRQRLAQQRFEELCIATGIEYSLVRSLDEMKELYERHMRRCT